MSTAADVSEERARRGRALRAARLAARVSQAQLARRTGFARSSISSVESGSQNIGRWQATRPSPQTCRCRRPGHVQVPSDGPDLHERVRPRRSRTPGRAHAPSPAELTGEPGVADPSGTRSAADARTGLGRSARLTRCVRPVTDAGACG
jgi:DNA-binding XRE family transcriptional regulator